MQIGKIKSTSITKNAGGFEVLVCTIEIRRNQTVTAEWLNSAGESATPIVNDWVGLLLRSQAIGGYLAFGFQDVLNQIFAERGVKVIYGRDTNGIAKTKISLTASEIILENPSDAQISLSEEKIILNEGSGFAIELSRLQTSLDAFSTVVLAEFQRVAAGTVPNPSAPYIPSANLPADISESKSETINLP